MKVGFVTCVELGLACMQAIYDAGGHIDFAVTIPDKKAPRKSGRVHIDAFCCEHGVVLFKTENINDAACVAFLREQHADLLFIIGWSQIASPDVLRSAGLSIGMHPTLLPTGRGRAAIPWAIAKGLAETGVTMFVLDEGVDTGDIISQIRVPIGDRETASTLYARLLEAHSRLMRDSWASLAIGTVHRRPQDHSKATVWSARTPADGELRREMSVVEVDRLVRATTHPYPGAFIKLADDRILRIWAGAIAQSRPQAQGTRRIQFANGDYDAVDWKEEASV
jgi:methionyl-tRNA formyltransferase